MSEVELESLKAQLVNQPENALTLYQIGMLLAFQKNYIDALSYLEHALMLEPNNPLFHNNFGNALKCSQQFEQAEKHYLKALDLNPNYPQAHNNLGVLYYFQGKLLDAKKQFEHALRYFPTYGDAHFNLANTLAQINQLPYAVIHYKQCLVTQPNHVQAIHNLGVSLTALGCFEEAEPYLLQAITHDSLNVEAHYHLGLIYASTNRLKQAIEHYRLVTTQRSDHANAWHNLATLLLHQDDRESAQCAYQQALTLDPNNITAKHMLNALAGRTTPEGAPREYVRALFDQYAPSYDAQVTKQLHYQVPHHLRTLVGNHAKNLTGLWKVADLGCGTGLCAPYFRDLSERLIGVDVSPKMLEIASRRGGYDSLIVEDALQYLKTHYQHDLIIAADVFVYFGELSDFFQIAQESLKPGGYFTFSIETVCGKNYQLQETGRYTHHPDYIAQICQTQSWQVIAIESLTLRTQSDQPVPGHVYLLRKNT